MKNFLLGGVAAIAIAGGALYLWMPNMFYRGMHQAGMHGMMHMGGQHDEMNMPMLNGIDTTPEEVAELRAMFENHTAITRTVENLPDGIRTVTETDDETLRPLLIAHVSGMIARVDDHRDPQIPIQSETLGPIFVGSEDIVTELEPTEKGIIVVQRSTNPEMVKLLQTHAAEVSDLAARGMEAVHERMMGN